MSFARGFIKGFIGQSLDKKAAADEALADLNARVAENYLTNIQPNFIKNEKNIESNFNIISKGISKPVALYSLAQGLTDNTGTNMIMNLPDNEKEDLKKYAESIDFQNYDFNLAKNTRALKYNEKYEGVTNQIKTMPGGSGASVTGLLIPYDETMGTSTFDASQLKPLSDITASGNNFDIMNRAHATEANRFSGDFDSYFYNRNLGTYVITGLDKDNPVYPLITNLLSDYDDAVARGYTGGQLQYARDKFINQKLSQVGIMNFPRPGYDNLPEAKTTAKTIDTSNIDVNQQTENVITESKAKKIDQEKVPAKKFDAGKSPGKKYDPEKSPGIRVTDESGAIMNEARQAISSISRSTTLSDEQKEEAIANVRAAAKEEIKKIGLDPDNFSF
jgi:hypothetical protein